MVALSRSLGAVLLCAACVLHTCGARDFGPSLLFTGESGRGATQAAAVESTDAGTERRELGACVDSCDMNRQLAKFATSFRAKNNKAKVCLSQKLIAAAKEHSEDMAKMRKATHTGSDGSLVAARVAAQGFTATKYGENVAKGYTTAAAVFNALKAEKGHRAIILGDYTHTGAFKKGTYWTQVFAKSTEPCDT